MNLDDSRRAIFDRDSWTCQRCGRPAADCEKYNSAACLGWTVLRYTTDMLRKNPGRVLDDVLLLIAARKNG